MEAIEKIISVSSASQIPSRDEILNLPYGLELILLFERDFRLQRERTGNTLKAILPDFLISIHTTKPRISIIKLISYDDIETHKLFFEQCAKDYRNLARKLIFQLSEQVKIKLDEDYPLSMFDIIPQDGSMGQWEYNLHGLHCQFTHMQTGQTIEVNLAFGPELGDLDPYFFTSFIKSTQAYQTLPVGIYNNYHDGYRINEKMLALGKFEKITSNHSNHYGIVVTDREKA